MACPFLEQQEHHPTWAHPKGMAVGDSPFVTRFGLALPDPTQSAAELTDLQAFAETVGDLYLPAVVRRKLAVIAFHAVTGCWDLPRYKDGLDTFPHTPQPIPDGQYMLNGLATGSVPHVASRSARPRARYPRIGTQNAHLVMFRTLRGADSIPGGHVLDHLCERKSCCYHRHLEAVTIAENNRRIHIARLQSAEQGTLT